MADATSPPRTDTATSVAAATNNMETKTSAVPASVDATASDTTSPAAVVTALTTDTTVTTIIMTGTYIADTTPDTITDVSSAVVVAATDVAAQDSVAVSQLSVQSTDDVPAPVQTLPELLDIVSTLVTQMVEAIYICRYVLKRMMAIHGHRPPIQDDDVAKLFKIAREFVAFLKEYANEPIGVYRLVHNRAIVAQIKGFHNDLDELSRGANVPMDDWQKTLTSCCNVLQDNLATMSRDKLKLCGLTQMAVKKQCKALALVAYELELKHAAYSVAELEVLRVAFNTLSQFSKGTLGRIEPWFLPPYEIKRAEKHFSHGSFANVYKATFFGAEVVVKVPKHQNSAFEKAAFAKEADAWFLASKIPNVVRFFGAYHLDNQPYFVSEYAENGTLTRFVGLNEKGRRMMWSLLLQAAYGLKGVHQLGISHNDLKCNNILVTGDLKAKLTDFGLSSFMAVETAQGAYRWKAPEAIHNTVAHAQAKAALESGTVTKNALAQASDVYSLGMCIWEAVSQCQPWGSMSDVAVKDNIEEGKLPDKPKHFTDDQWALVKAMCAFKPMDRIDMDNVILRLKKFANDERNSQYTPESESCPCPPVAAPCASKVVVAEPVQKPATTQDAATSLKITDHVGEQGSAIAAPALSRFESEASSAVPRPQEDFIVSASVNDYRFTTAGRHEFVEYKVSLKMASGRSKCEWKRYSSFRHFYMHLLRDAADPVFSSSLQPLVADLPAFPRRTTFWFTLTSAAIEQRKRELSEYLSQVVATYGVPFGMRLSDAEFVYKPGTKPKFVL